MINIISIVLVPLAAFALGSTIASTRPMVTAFLSTGAIFLSFVLCLIIFGDYLLNIYDPDYVLTGGFPWIDLSYGGEEFTINMGFYVDNMAAVMLLMVSGVSTLIHIFSTYYMADDPRCGRFFVYLSLFTSAMLGLVLSDNLLGIFICWEIMGFCSWGLIGHYFEKEEAGLASLKAFMTTRVGDVFFLLGLVIIWSVVGSVHFRDIYAGLEQGFFSEATFWGMPLISLAALCLFMGTIGKSAQFPLQVWLPDAMMGPTPCSALIHAATMVAAGVYLSLRSFPLMEAANLLPFIAYIGAITAFLAATMALIQKDFKAVLAYSTISQLGYMVLGIGVKAYNPAFMHLITHAVFKACLFLSAGAVIHTIHTQEMDRMGGLKDKLKITWIVMWCCTLAIAGVPLFSGFVSKDRILGEALIMASSHWVYGLPAVLGFVAAGLTAFYMFRMMFLVFHGTPRDEELYGHTKEEKIQWNKNIPLIILAVFTLGVWFCGSLTGQGLIPLASDRYEWLQTLVVRPLDPGPLSEEEAHHAHSVHVIGAILSLVVASCGIFLSFMMYQRRAWDPRRWVQALSAWYRVLENKYHMDDLYIRGLIGRVLHPVCRGLGQFDLRFYDRFAVDGWAKVNEYCFRFARWFDDLWVDRALVDGTGTSVRLFNVVLRMVQSGKIQFYIAVIVVVLAGYIWTVSI